MLGLSHWIPHMNIVLARVRVNIAEAFVNEVGLPLHKNLFSIPEQVLQGLDVRLHLDLILVGVEYQSDVVYVPSHMLILALPALIVARRPKLLCLHIDSMVQHIIKIIILVRNGRIQRVIVGCET